MNAPNGEDAGDIDDPNNDDLHYTVDRGNHEEGNVRKTNAFVRAEAFLLSVMNARVDLIPASSGMRVMRDVVKLETGKKLPIILRSITEPFWQACINAVDQQSLRIAAVGTPGVGKTTSTPWLIRMLLKEDKTVVYLIRTNDKSRWYYEFIPNGSVVTINVYPEALTREEIPSLNSSDTYYIVDPGQSTDSCNPPSDFEAKVILVSSPNHKHWGGSEFAKDRDTVRGKFRYYPTWTYEELLVAREILRPDLMEEEIRERFWKFGGVPRNIFKLEVDDLIDDQNSAINALSPDQAKRIALGEITAADETFSERTKSALMGFRLSIDDTSTFEKWETYIVSARVSEAIVVKFMDDLWNVMLSREANDGKGMIFERITRHIIASGKLTEFQVRRCVGKTNADYNKRRKLTLGTGRTQMRQVVDPMESAQDDAMANVVFYPISPFNPLYDFLYKDTSGHFHVFQATVGRDHSANAAKIQDLEVQAGGASNLSFYFLVPASTFLSFVTKPAEPKRTLRKKKVSFKNLFHVEFPKPNEEQTGSPEGSDQL